MCRNDRYLAKEETAVAAAMDGRRRACKRRLLECTKQAERATTSGVVVNVDGRVMPMPQRCPENYWASKRKDPLFRTHAIC
jgi:hypothetical protein